MLVPMRMCRRPWQDPSISREAGRYIVWLIVAMFLSGVATLLFRITLCWVLVFKTSMGLVGAALPISILYWLNIAMLVLYIAFSSSCKDTRSPPTMEAFRVVDVFLPLALPSAFMICLEWWSFELLVLLSGLLPNPELQTSVLSICLMSITLLFTIPYGLGAAASMRLENELGARNAEGAQSAIHVVMCITVTEAVLLSGMLLASRRLLGSAYRSKYLLILVCFNSWCLICFNSWCLICFYICSLIPNFVAILTKPAPPSRF